jgi:hypothetical protein
MNFLRFRGDDPLSDALGQLHLGNPTQSRTSQQYSDHADTGSSSQTHYTNPSEDARERPSTPLPIRRSSPPPIVRAKPKGIEKRGKSGKNGKSGKK